ncbi:hypothetical protein IW140_005994 [Coemansia sp. RSA 1813]|nr:hypothetical protein LPJ74_005468 [Coemansia sp. RSA 1843]KAJ2210817.1 hypothetical protein EV179_005970 [Coemansia sp. RSA 487]KAJ2563755.1 hypothetical protein IW140_005994 [Coemansia sp. RSA 1813]
MSLNTCEEAKNLHSPHKSGSGSGSGSSHIPTEDSTANMYDATMSHVSIYDDASVSFYNDIPNDFALNTFNVASDLLCTPKLARAPPKEVVLSWDNLSYEIEAGINNSNMTATRTILSQVSGQVRASETIAIIGSSGAGKTTLLNALSGRIVGGHLTGEIIYRGTHRNAETFKRDTSYVKQDDLMHPLLTVEETLTFASRLRLPNNHYSIHEKNKRVSSIIKQLRLGSVRGAQIGSVKTARGISGGERKRVSIGTELLTDPRLLFLDEPTSGLDSNSSQQVVELVKTIARERNIAVLMTIHQPSARIFNTFDKIILLSQGHLVYFGPTSTAIEYFANIGYQCPVHENPADYFVDLMTLDYRNERVLAESKSRVSILVYNFIRYKAKRLYDGQNNVGSSLILGDKDVSETQISDIQPSSLPLPQTESLHLSQNSRNSWMHEYKTLVKRDWVNILRNRPYLVSQLMQSLFTGLIVGFMFFYLKHDSISVQNRMGILYTIALNATFPIIMPALQAFFEERDIMLRERAAGVYRATAFYMSKITTFAPIALVCGVIFTTGVYFISRLSFGASKFFTALGVFSCLNVVSISFMLMIGSAVKSMDVAFVVAPAIVIIELLFGGLIANPTTITAALKWVRWINPVYYTYAALVKNEFSGQTFSCAPGTQCYTTGEQVIHVYGMDRFSILQDSLFLLLIAAVFNIVGYALLRWKSMPKYILL